MNISGLLVGSVGEIAQDVGIQFIQKLMPNNSPKFLDKLKEVESHERLSLNDLELDPSQLQSIMELRDIAIEEGLESIEVQINGQSYLMQTADLSLVPRLSLKP